MEWKSLNGPYNAKSTWLIVDHQECLRCQWHSTKHSDCTGIWDLDSLHDSICKMRIGAKQVGWSKLKWGMSVGIEWSLCVNKQGSTCLVSLFLSHRLSTHSHNWFEAPDCFSFSCLPWSVMRWIHVSWLSYACSSRFPPHPSWPHLGHMNPLSLIEKHFVLQPNLYAMPSNIFIASYTLFGPCTQPPLQLGAT